MTFKTVVAIVFVSGLAACGGKPADEPVSEPVALVKTMPATIGDLPVIKSGFGAIEFDPAGQHTLSTEIEARVLELNAQPGDRVDKNSVIVKLAPSSAAGVDITRTRRDATAAEAVAARARRLRKDGLVSDAEVEAADITARDLLEQAASLEQRAASVLSMRSPITGIVDAIYVKPGDLISPGTQMVRLASPDAIQARVSLEIDDAARLKAGDAVRLSALVDTNITVDCTIRNIDMRIDPATRMSSALVSVPVGRGLFSGEAIRADIILEIHQGVLIVPREAVFLDETGAYVFINKNGVAVLKRVDAGHTNGNQMQIDAGISAGDAIIVEGGAILSDGMRVRTSDTTAAAQP